MDKNELTHCCQGDDSREGALRRNRQSKNWIVLALVLGGAALIWAVTMIKIQHGG
ncbi:MAG: hypothetical protein WC043_06105 [Pseudobdellovibrionaceae bacterium]